MPLLPTFRKPTQVAGHRLILRNAVVADAEFIVGLRTDDDLARFLSATSARVEDQAAWLARYGADDAQVYFIIQTADGKDVGTVRLYDQRDDSFCWGSWILQRGQPSAHAIESALLVYHFGLSLGFERAHFDVRKGNQSVWRFHERFGATRIGESDLDYLYEISGAAIRTSLHNFGRLLPDGVRVSY
jgi:RimJ/RimL family protein N-acetyltransferase